MADDVVEHPGRSEQQAPRERERAARRARAPARALIAHGDGLRRDAEPGRLALDRGLERRRAPRCGTSARAPPPRPRRRARAARAHRRSSRHSSALRGDDAQRDGLAAVPRDARRARGRAHRGCWRASARSSQGASVFSALSIALVPVRAGTTSSGPTPGTSTSRSRRARDERRSRTFTAPLRRSTVRSPSTSGRLCAVLVEQITEPLALHGEGPCWLERSGELAWVDMLAGRVLATSLATGETRVIDVPGRSRRSCGRAPPAVSWSQPRRASSLLDEHDAPSLLCEILRRARHPHERRRLRPAGAVLVREHGVRRQPGSGLAVSRRGRRQRSPTQLTGVTISNGLGWSPDGETAFYVDSMAYGIDTLRVRRRERRRSPSVAGSPMSRGASACPTGSRWTPRAASGSRSGTAEQCTATRPTARSTPSSRCPAGG